MNEKTRRLSREAWLERSLEILDSEGQSRLTIDYLTKQLHVTKGSFYWHFKNRASYIECLAEYWADEYTLRLARPLPEEISDASDRLLALMTRLTETDYARYDAAVLNWSQHEPGARQSIQKVLDFRMHFIRTLFSELGFTGNALEMRVQTVLTFHTMELNGYNHLSKEERLRHVKLRHEMLTHK